MSNVNVLVLTGYGLNCDYETGRHSRGSIRTAIYRLSTLCKNEKSATVAGNADLFGRSKRLQLFPTAWRLNTAVCHVTFNEAH